MGKHFLSIIFCLIIYSINGQTTVDLYSYKCKTKNQGGLYLAETVRMLSDSTFVLNTYELESKKDLRQLFTGRSNQIPYTSGGTYRIVGTIIEFSYSESISQKAKKYFITGKIEQDGNRILVHDNWKNEEIEKPKIFVKEKNIN